MPLSLVSPHQGHLGLADYMSTFLLDLDQLTTIFQDSEKGRCTIDEFISGLGSLFHDFIHYILYLDFTSSSPGVRLI